MTRENAQDQTRPDHKPTTKQDKKKEKKSKHIFPCPMSPEENHDHELGHCSKYFELSPAKRTDLSKYKNCFTCLRSYRPCQEGCKNLDKVIQAKLICDECKTWAEKRNKSPKNILLCTNADHNTISSTELKDRLKVYLKDSLPVMGESMYYN